MTATPPIIGITLDAEEPGGYSPLPWYALRKEYFTLISSMGAIPIALPHEISQVEPYLSLIDGLILTGGDFDIPPEMYGQSFTHDTVVIKNQRTKFETAMTLGALSQHMPILGICAGQQLLNVLLGGTLIQHIPDEIQDPLEHQQPISRTEPWHSISITEASKLHQITGETELHVNSNHHQSVKDVGKNVTISAYAPDGVIEAIEYDLHPFCIGVQWHPELQTNDGDKKLFQSFLNACNT